jgi:hypothetical protein
MFYQVRLAQSQKTKSVALIKTKAQAPVRTAPGHARRSDVVVQSGGFYRAFHCRWRLDELDFTNVKSYAGSEKEIRLFIDECRSRPALSVLSRC